MLKKIIFDKMAAMRTLKTLFPACFNMGYDCDMLGLTQLFLWPRYFDISFPY